MSSSIVFGYQMPLRQETPTGLMDFLSSVLSQSGPNRLPYSEDVRWTIRGHLNSTIQAFPGLSVTQSTWRYSDGRVSNILQVEGTIPMHFQYAKYNIPVKICLLEDYPRGPPLVFVVPTRDMVIKTPHPFVDAAGAVRSSHLQQWVYPRSELKSMVQELSEMFGQNPPLYSRLTPGPTNPPPPPSQSSSLYHSTPPPIPPSPVGMLPYPMHSGNFMQMPSPAPSQTPHPPPPPPPPLPPASTSIYPPPSALTQNPPPLPSTFLTSSLSTRPLLPTTSQLSPPSRLTYGVMPPSLRRGSMNDGGATPLPGPSSITTTTSSSSALPIPTPTMSTPPPRPPPPLETSSDALKWSIVIALKDKLDADVAAYDRKLVSERESQSKIQARLARRSSEIESGVRELAEEKEALEHRLQVVLTNTDVLESWLTENETKCSRGGDEGDGDSFAVNDEKVMAEIDSVFVPADSLSKQLLESMAQDLALEDVMYSLDKALHDGVISLDMYMKHTRMCAREQFFQRATEVLVSSVQSKHHAASYGGGVGGGGGGGIFPTGSMNVRRTSYTRS